jgi:hypothetical protein
MNGEAPVAIPTTFKTQSSHQLPKRSKTWSQVERKYWLHTSWQEVAWQKESSQILSHSKKVKWFGWIQDI